MVDLEKIKKELTEDTKLDELNLLEKQLILPSIKHKWVYRLIEEKRRLNSLIKKKKITKLAVLASLEEQNSIPPGVSKSSLDKRIEDSDPIQKIEEDIRDTELLIEYLEKVETIFKSMTYDLSNIIKIQTLEIT
jgi:hypothetical protein